VVIPLAFFTSVATKLPWYVLPIYPALALLTAWLLQQLTPAVPLTRDVLVGALLVIVALTNARSNWVDNRSWAVKRVGHCAQLAAAPSETIAFFAPRQPDEPPSVRPLFNVLPSVRFYADRLVWSDTLGARELAGLILPVVRVGNQQLASLDESTPLLDACQPNFP